MHSPREPRARDLIEAVLEAERVSVGAALLRTRDITCRSPLRGLYTLCLQFWAGYGHPIVREVAHVAGLVYGLLAQEEARRAFSLVREWCRVDPPGPEEFCEELRRGFLGEHNVALAAAYGLSYYVIRIVGVEDISPETVPHVDWLVVPATLYYLAWRTDSCRSEREAIRVRGSGTPGPSPVLSYLSIVGRRWRLLSLLLLAAGLRGEALLPPLISMLRPGRPGGSAELEYVNGLLGLLRGRGGEVGDPENLVYFMAGLVAPLMCHHRGLPPKGEIARSLVNAWLVLHEAEATARLHV